MRRYVVLHIGGLCVVTVVCLCAVGRRYEVLYTGICVLCLLCSDLRLYGVLYIGVLCVVTVECCCSSLWGAVYFLVSVVWLWCAVVRWYAVLYKGRIVYCECGVLLCVGMDCFILGGGLLL